MGLLLRQSFLSMRRVSSSRPNFVAIIHKAVAGTRSDALARVAGIVTVNLFWATCAILDIGTVFAIFPGLAVGVRLVGATYLIWFGLRLVVSARAPHDCAGMRQAFRLQSPRRSLTKQPP